MTPGSFIPVNYPPIILLMVAALAFGAGTSWAACSG